MLGLLKALLVTQVQWTANIISSISTATTTIDLMLTPRPSAPPPACSCFIFLILPALSYSLPFFSLVSGSSVSFAASSSLRMGIFLTPYLERRSLDKGAAISFLLMCDGAVKWRLRCFLEEDETFLFNFILDLGMDLCLQKRHRKRQ